MKVLNKELERHGDSVTRALVRVEPDGEVAEGVTCLLMLALTVSSAAWKNPDIRAELTDVQTKLTQAFSAVKGVDLIDLSVVSEGEFTLDDVGEFVRWDYADYLSPTEVGSVIRRGPLLSQPERNVS
jgi:hypothetical protein